MFYDSNGLTSSPQSVSIDLSALFLCFSIHQESQRFLQQLLVQSQFSLGCALSCSLHFLHEGASQRWLCLLLAASLSWFLARQATGLLHHVMSLYKLHSSQRYCGICIGLLTSGRFILPMLCRAMFITSSVAVIAAVSVINQHFLSATEALRFWTPLTICYTLLVVYMQGEKQRNMNASDEMHVWQRMIETFNNRLYNPDHESIINLCITLFLTTWSVCTFHKYFF